MDRREALRILGSAAAISLVSPEWLALGRSVHAQTLATPGRGTLTPGQDALVSVLAELILPQTDTPGATAARVNEFIDRILTEWHTEEERDRFLAGLEETDGRARTAFGKSFLECTEREQVALLTEMDAEVMQLRQSEAAGGVRPPAAPRSLHHFFHMLKRLTLFGYFTSEVGCPPDGAHLVVPEYMPCAPVAEITKLLKGSA